MGNKATTVEQQITQLKKRGMLMDLGEDKAKEILLDIGYYRLGFYWNPFEIDTKHNFIKDTLFSDIIDLYYLDVDLRYILIKHINRLELNFRTNLIYWASNYYNDNPIWYTSTGIMSPEYLKDIKSHYHKNFIKKNIQIKRHHERNPDDKYAPCWKTFEYYTFGSIVKIYENINNDELKKTIALRYNIKKSDKFLNVMNTLVFVRNSCAHSGVVYDLHIDEGISELDGVTFNNSYSHNMDAAIRVLLYLTHQISIERKTELDTALTKLFKRFTDNPTIKKIIEEKLGYIYV